MTVAQSLARQTAVRERIRASSERAATQAWAALPGINDSAQDEFLSRILPIVTSGQRTTALATSAYAAEVLTAQTGTSVAPVVGATAGFRGVAPEKVYLRPFVAVYTALSKGVAPDLARGIGADRLLRLVEDDLALAHRNAARDSFSDSTRVTKYRRVIRPELSKDGTCPLCVTASDQTYSTGELMPIHTRCFCDVMPITDSGADPGARMNSSDLDSLPEGERSGAPIAVREHGELGPVLTRAGDNFTGPDDLTEAA